MELQYRVLIPEQASLIRDLEIQKLNSEIQDELLREMTSWNAPWRSESLAHYLPMGWCAGAWEVSNQNLVGYFLGQPLLFWRGQTQCLWIEHLYGVNVEVQTGLVDIAFRYSRDKHLQSVVFQQKDDLRDILSQFRCLQIKDLLVEGKTTRT